MKRILEELKSTPGVIGVFALHPKNGILANCMPNIFKPDKLTEVSRQLLKIHAATRMNSKSMQDISLYFDGSVVMLREVSDQLFLVTVCEPQVNANMINMSVNLVAEELEEHDAGSAAAPSAPEQKEGATPESIRASGPLATPLEKVEATLAGIMGPMAEMILEEAIEEWCRSGKASFENLSSLVRILCREIGDARKVEQFQTQIGPYGLI